MQRFIISSLISILKVLLAPIIVPIGSINNRIKQSRIYQEAARTDCSKCGNHLGMISVARASDQFKNMAEEIKNKYPTMAISFGRPFAAICTHCDCHYDYDPVEKSIIPAHSVA